MWFKYRYEEYGVSTNFSGNTAIYGNNSGSWP